MTGRRPTWRRFWLAMIGRPVDRTDLYIVVIIWLNVLAVACWLLAAGLRLVGLAVADGG